MTSSAFFDALYQATDQHIFVTVKQQVADAMSVSPESLDKMLDSATEPFAIIRPEDLLMYLYYALTPDKGTGS